MTKRCQSIPSGLYPLLGPQIMHKNGTNREYQVAVLYDKARREYVVFCAWGKQGDSLDGQVKSRETSTADAVALAQSWVMMKENRGYTVVAWQPLGLFDEKELQNALIQVKNGVIKPISRSKQPALRAPRYGQRNMNTPANGALFASQKWSDFLTSTGIADIELFEYYFGSTPATVKIEHFNKLIQEVFLDAVDAGAIQLPQKIKAEDFGFFFMRRDSQQTADTLTVVHEPTYETRSVSCVPDVDLAPKLLMSNDLLRQVLQIICERSLARMRF